MKIAQITGNFKKISQNRTLRRLGKPEQGCSGTSAKPATAPLPKRVAPFSTANARPNTKS